MAADEKEAGKTTEEAPEVLPTSTEEAAPKKSKMLIAVVVVAILIIAAIGIAWMAGVFGKPTTANVNPTVTTSMSTHAAAVGEVVTFNSTATDSDGTIASVLWDFGDGLTSTVANTTHAYSYPGQYIAYCVVTDNSGGKGDNEPLLTSMMIIVSGSAINEPSATDVNATAPPFLVLAANQTIIQMNATVSFDCGASWAFVGSWTNSSNHSEGVTWEQNISGIESFKLNYSDGSAVLNIITTVWPVNASASHKFTAQGNYAVKLTGMSGTNNSTYIKTVHVLKAAPPAGAVKNPDTFIMATIGEPQTLDPAIDYESAGGEILMNVYENLIWFNGASAVDLVPILALAVPTIANGLISADGMNYSFQLRQGVKFHDGTNMTADDVIYSIQRLCALFTPRTPAWMMEQVLDYNVGNAMYRGYNITKWEARFGPVPAYLKVGLPTSGAHVLTAADVRTVVANAVTSNSTYNVTFRLTMPYPAFLQILSYTDANIVSKDYVVANGDAYMKTHTCGTGPYKLVSWDKNSAVRLVRNDDYWRTPAKIKNIVILKIEDVNSRQLMLKAGDADSAYIPIQFQDQFADTSQFRIVKGLPTFQIDFIGFNQYINVSELKGLYGSGVVSGIPITTASGCEYSDFFADIHVRKAFAMAINYTQYIASAFLGNAQQINGPIPDGMFGYNASVPKMPYDWAAAKDNLSKGVVDWIANGFKIPMFYNAGNSYREAAMNMFKDSIESMSPGKITLDIKPVDWAVYMDISSEVPCPYPMICVGWQIDYADPDDFVLPFMNSGYCFAPPQNYVNLTVDALIAEAASETNLTKRAELYTNITWAAYYDVPYVWLIQAKNFHVERSWVQGYYYNPMYSGFYYYSFDK